MFVLQDPFLGQPYLDYKQRVKGRIIPGLPV